MPLIVVYGLAPHEFEETCVDFMEKTIISAVVGVKELKLTAEDISFAFNSDPSIARGMAVDVVIIVELLFEKPGRTLQVRRKLAEAIAAAFRALDKRAKKDRIIEVAVKRFDPKKDGFFRIDL